MAPGTMLCDYSLYVCTFLAIAGAAHSWAEHCKSCGPSDDSFDFVDEALLRPIIAMWARNFYVSNPRNPEALKADEGIVD